MKTARLAAITTAVILLAGCSANDPLEMESEPEPDPELGQQVVVGSQDYYSNEIIAEIYAQVLEDAGYEVQRQFSIGQRDAYMPSIEAGEISIFPEYTGNLLQHYDPETEARESLDVYEELEAALPDGLEVLAQAEASDQDSITVTQEFADEHDLSTIADLTEIDDDLTLGGPPELAERPYGPEGLESLYDLKVEFQATGETTVEELEAGTVDLANVYTADPRIQTLELVSLADPEGLFLASQVVPLVNSELGEELGPLIDPISDAMTPEALVSMNVQSQEDQEASEDIAQRWLEDNDLLL